MIERYIVSSSGRSGSHIVLATIQLSVRAAIHTHYPLYKTDNDTITGLIIVGRRNLFATIMSNMLVDYTGQTTEYQQINFAPFLADKDSFVYHYNWHRWYNDNHELTRTYGLVKTLYFEDFVNDYDFILKELNLVRNPTFEWMDGALHPIPIVNHNYTVKAPYSYQDLIINQDQCLEWFKELQATESFVKFSKDRFAHHTDDELNQPWIDPMFTHHSEDELTCPNIKTDL
jgi:hypothetical protein